MKNFGLGGMRLPMLDKTNFRSIDQEQVNKMVDKMLAAGFTYFDTAYPYHNGASETSFGKALVQRYPRESFVLADKMPSFFVEEESQLEKIFSEQLQRTGAGYFDYYLLHNVGAGSYARMNKIGAFDFILNKKKEGYIKHIGFSFHDKAELLDKILTDHPEVEFVQLQINYLDWESASVQSRLNYETACRHNKPVFVMEPIKGSGLASLPEKAEKQLKEYNPSASCASWALRFAASLPNVKMVLSGMSNIEQVEENIATMTDFKPLNYEERELLNKTVDILNSLNAVACTGCRYCTDTCPKNINIPGYFSVYNAFKLHGYVNFPIMQYVRQAHGHGFASECIGCGKCESHCPQHLEIRKYLKEIAEAFEPKIDPTKKF